MKNRKSEHATRARRGRPVAAQARRRHRARKAKHAPLSLSGLLRGSKLHTMTIADFYRPLKKPVSLRLDADVLAWFKKDGRRYQTRINQALRKVMEREIKHAT
jgi:uncharacterized protein (DUF4415 family)